MSYIVTCKDKILISSPNNYFRRHNFNFNIRWSSSSQLISNKPSSNHLHPTMRHSPIKFVVLHYWISENKPFIFSTQLYCKKFQLSCIAWSKYRRTSHSYFQRVMICIITIEYLNKYILSYNWMLFYFKFKITHI